MITLRFTTAELRTVEVQHEVEVDGEVYRGWWIHRPIRGGDSWDVTHPRSGLLLRTGIPTRASARRLCAELTKRGVDPNAKVEDMNAAVAHMAVKAWQLAELGELP